MRAVGLFTQGSLEVLEVVDVPEVHAGPGEVRIRVHAATVNPTATTVDGDKTGSSAYHGWVITPTDDGCDVLTEETQQGPWFLDQLGHKYPHGLYRYHELGAESLARAAETEVARKAG